MPLPNRSSKKSAPPPLPMANECERLGSIPVTKPLVKGVLPGRPFPRRIALLLLWRDESGSMSHYRSQQSAFVPAVLDALVSAPGGREAADRIYVGYFVMSGGVTAGPVVPLTQLAAHTPPYEPDGYTPVGPAAEQIAREGDAFLREVYAAEASVVAKELLVFGDLWPSGPGGDDRATEAGVADLLAFVARHGFQVTVVAPAPDAVNRPLAERLASPERPVAYLGDDPTGILKLTVRAVSSASRALTGARPPVS